MKDPIQEQLIAARRNQILEAAAKVFATKGFHPTTIKDIAKEAGIADGTIYNYFDNKTALLFGIFERMRETAQQDENFVKLDELDFRSFLIGYLRPALMAPKEGNFALFRVIISEIMVNAELRELYYQKVLEPTIMMAESYFQHPAAQQTLKPVNISLTLRAISGMVLGLILEHIMGDKTLEAQWEELPEFLADLILNGLSKE